MCEILNIVEGYDLKSMGFNSAASIHVMTEAMRHAYMDRNTYLGDPAFVKNPVDRLISKSYAEEIRKKIEADKATPSTAVQPGMEPHEKPETTHYSIVDKMGNAVSTTYTINGLFGSVVIAPGTGFFLNDEMDDFTVKVGEKNLFGLVQGVKNSIAPGKRPLSSMSPSLVTKDGKIFMVLDRRAVHASSPLRCSPRSMSSTTAWHRRKPSTHHVSTTNGCRTKCITSSAAFLRTA